MAKKSGDLRIRKAAAVFGPMSRDDLDRLLAAGKVTLDDQVSMRGGEWMTLGDFLAANPLQSPQPARPSADATTTVLPPADSDPVLRLLANKRIVAALSRAEVMQLHKSGRIGDDDLLCALYGPWMRVGDFLVTPHAASTASVDRETSQPAPPPITPLILPGPTSVADVSPSAASALIAQALSDEWYGRVRGIHSAPLGKRHVQALFEAKEITRDCVARHAAWPDDTWLPIHAIPQLAECVV